jgi:hypothetical protein
MTSETLRNPGSDDMKKAGQTNNPKSPLLANIRDKTTTEGPRSVILSTKDRKSFSVETWNQ